MSRTAKTRSAKGAAHELVHAHTTMVITIFLLGVGGFSLGGGYSWKTNQVGLTIDTIVGFDLVLPTGKAVQVTSKSNPDLFFALKVYEKLLREVTHKG